MHKRKRAKHAKNDALNANIQKIHIKYFQKKNAENAKVQNVQNQAIQKSKKHKK